MTQVNLTRCSYALFYNFLSPILYLWYLWPAPEQSGLFFWPYKRQLCFRMLCVVSGTTAIGLFIRWTALPSHIGHDLIHWKQHKMYLDNLGITKACLWQWLLVPVVYYTILTILGQVLDDLDRGLELLHDGHLAAVEHLDSLHQQQQTRCRIFISEFKSSIFLISYFDWNKIFDNVSLQKNISFSKKWRNDNLEMILILFWDILTVLEFCFHLQHHLF